jgi:hypothetical protein
VKWLCAEINSLLAWNLEMAVIGTSDSSPFIPIGLVVVICCPSPEQLEFCSWSWSVVYGGVLAALIIGTFINLPFLPSSPFTSSPLIPRLGCGYLCPSPQQLGFGSRSVVYGGVLAMLIIGTFISSPFLGLLVPACGWLLLVTWATLLQCLVSFCQKAGS